MFKDITELKSLPCILKYQLVDIHVEVQLLLMLMVYFYSTVTSFVKQVGMVCFRAS
jgi:hypothetical protein